MVALPAALSTRWAPNRRRSRGRSLRLCQATGVVSVSEAVSRLVNVDPIAIGPEVLSTGNADVTFIATPICSRAPRPLRTDLEIGEPPV
jgi:hypothetical protein